VRCRSAGAGRLRITEPGEHQDRVRRRRVAVIARTEEAPAPFPRSWRRQVLAGVTTNDRWYLDLRRRPPGRPDPRRVTALGAALRRR
jgi:hypothetical protein